MHATYSTRKILDITRDEIKATARTLMGQSGTAGLSIRAIARQMEMTPPALYHYYPSLHELITALIIDAFGQLADAVEAATTDRHWRTSAEQIAAAAHATRNWALKHPIDFQLIYGNPIPGYDQPTEVTYPPARRSFINTARVFAQAIDRGEIDLPAAYQQFPARLEASLNALSAIEGHALPPAALYLTAVAWTKIHGHIMLELFNLIQPVIADVDAFFEYEIKLFLKQVGLNKHEGASK